MNSPLSFFQRETYPTGLIKDWGQFWKSVGVGAISGAASYGIGQAVSSMNLSSFGQATTGAFLHGLSGGIISGLTGGDPALLSLL